METAVTLGANVFLQKCDLLDNQLPPYVVLLDNR